MLPTHVNLIKLRAESAPTIERLKRAGVDERKFFTRHAFMGPIHSAFWGSLLFYGKPFLDSFPERKFGGFSIRLGPTQYESPVAVSLFSPKGRRLFSAKLGFDEGAVIVEALQGAPVPDWRSPEAESVARWVKGKYGAARQFDVPVNKWLVEFERLTSVPAPNYLIKEIEKIAAANDYKEVHIRRPEKLWWYMFYEGKGGHEEFLDRLRKLYYGVGKAEGYRKSGDFLVKKLLR